MKVRSQFNARPATRRNISFPKASIGLDNLSVFSELFCFFVVTAGMPLERPLNLKLIHSDVTG